MSAGMPTDEERSGSTGAEDTDELPSPETHEDRSRKRLIIITLVAVILGALVGYLMVLIVGR